MLVAIFCLFLDFQKINIKQRKNFGLIFSRLEETLEDSGEDLTSHVGMTSSGGAPGGRGGGAPRLVGPLWHLLT